MKFICHICKVSRPEHQLAMTHDGDQVCSCGNCLDVMCARLLMCNGGDIRTAGKERIAEAAREVIEFATRKGELLAAVEVRQFEPVAGQ